MSFKPNPGNDRDSQVLKALELVKEAALLGRDGGYEEAVQVYDRALSLLRNAASEAPHISEFGVATTEVLLSLGHLHTLHGNLNDSHYALKAAVDTSRSLVGSSDGDNRNVMLKLFYECVIDAVDNLLHFERFQEGLKVSRDLFVLSKEILAREPDSEEIHHMHARVMRMCMDFEEACGNRQEAYDMAGDRTSFEMDLLEVNPSHPSAKWRLADAVLDRCRYLKGERLTDQCSALLTIMEDLKAEGRLQEHQVASYNELHQMREELHAIVDYSHAHHNPTGPSA